MTKITDLKLKYSHLASELDKQQQKGMYEFGVKIANNYSITVNGGQIVAKMIPGSENDRWKTLQVYIKANRYYKNSSYISIDADEERYLKAHIKLMFEYWKEYVQAKSLKDVEFLAVGGELNSKLIEILKAVLLENTDEKYLSLINFVCSKSKENYLGGTISNDFMKYMDDFFVAQDIFKELMTKNTLVTFSSGTEENDMFDSRFYIDFCGESIRMVPKEDFSKVVVEFVNSKTFQNEERELKWELHSFLEFFEDIQTQLRMLNAFNPPLKKLKEAVSQLFSESKEEIIDTIYNSLLDKLETWEEIESEFGVIMDNYTYSEKGNILDVKREYGSQEIIVTNINSNKRYYHFISTKNPEDSKMYRNHQIIVSDSQYPNEVKELVLKYLLPNF